MISLFVPLNFSAIIEDQFQNLVPDQELYEDSFEPNDDINSSSTINLNSSQTHSIYPSQDHDFINFVLPNISIVYLELEYQSSLYLAMYEGNHQVFFNQSIVESVNVTLPSGSTYLEIYALNSSEVFEYNITLTAIQVFEFQSINTTETALDVQIGLQYELESNPKRDGKNQWFHFTVNKIGNYRIMTFKEGVNHFNPWLYKFAPLALISMPTTYYTFDGKDPYGLNNNTNTLFQHNLIYLASGEYYIKVNRSSTYTTTYPLKIIPLKGDEYESDDSALTSNRITSTNTFEFNFHNETDEDWINIEFTKPFSVLMRFILHKSENVQTTIYSEDLATLVDTQNSTVFLSLPMGKYFLRLQSPTGSLLFYGLFIQIAIEDEYEVDDDLEFATQLTNGESRFHSLTEDDRDWFSISLNRESLLRVTLTPYYYAIPNIIMYSNASGSMREIKRDEFCSDDCIPTEVEIRGTIYPGLYFFEVSSYLKIVDGYEITFIIEQEYGDPIETNTTQSHISKEDQSKSSIIPIQVSIFPFMLVMYLRRRKCA